MSEVSFDRESILTGTVKELCALIDVLKGNLAADSPLLEVAEKSVAEARKLAGKEVQS